MSDGRGPQLFGFIGVTASRSSINHVFPRWAEVLELGEVAFDPVDLRLDADVDTYRAEAERIKHDPRHRGALVTTHKVRLLEAAGDLIDELDANARMLGEVSCLSKRDGRLIGHAKDPITAGRSMDDFIPEGHFGHRACDALCLGAGGAGLAIAVQLLTGGVHAGRPNRVTLVDPDRARLDECSRVLEQLGVAGAVELSTDADPDANDRRCAEAPPGSLVVNASGMGKDRPGSPLTDGSRFPEHGLVWELNYRGELDFLRQARRQEDERDLTVEDGWRYFVHGWSEVVAEVFDLDIDVPTLDRLADEAAAVRS